MTTALLIFFLVFGPATLIAILEPWSIKMIKPCSCGKPADPDKMDFVGQFETLFLFNCRACHSTRSFPLTDEVKAAIKRQIRQNPDVDNSRNLS